MLRCDASEIPPPGRAPFGVRFTLTDMGNGVTRVEPYDVLTPDDACVHFGTPGCECVPLPIPVHLQMCIEDALGGVGRPSPRDGVVRACVRAVTEETVEVVAFCRP